jgi:hypothetical protein
MDSGLETRQETDLGEAKAADLARGELISVPLTVTTRSVDVTQRLAFASTENLCNSRLAITGENPNRPHREEARVGNREETRVEGFSEGRKGAGLGREACPSVEESVKASVGEGVGAGGESRLALDRAFILE